MKRILIGNEISASAVSLGCMRMASLDEKGVDAVMRLPFGHVWCCNRSLADIVFEDCRFEDVCKPMRLTCPAEEPLSLAVRNCLITAREGFAEIPLIEGEHVAKIELERVSLRGFQNAAILCEPKAEVIQI